MKQNHTRRPVLATAVDKASPLLHNAAKAAFLLLLLACFPGAAQAQLVCSLSLMPVTFDALRSSDAGAFDARGSVTVSCSGSNGAAIAACVDMIPPSANAAGQILLSGPAKGGALPFQVFQDAGLRLPWGSAGAGRGAVLTRTGDGVMTAPVYARLYVQAKAAAAGTYAAHIPVTLRYGAAEAGPVNCASLGAGSTPGGRGGRANAPAGAVRGPAPALGGAVMTPAPGSRR